MKNSAPAAAPPLLAVRIILALPVVFNCSKPVPWAAVVCDVETFLVASAGTNPRYWAALFPVGTCTVNLLAAGVLESTNSSRSPFTERLALTAVVPVLFPVA